MSSLLRAIRRRVGSPLTCFGLLIVFLACCRLSLISTGHFFWGDERWYLSASDLIDEVARGEYVASTRHLYEARGPMASARPGFVLVSVLPVLTQRVIGTFAGIDRDSLQYYDIASAFNVLVTLGVTGCVFAIGRIWTGSYWFGLLIATVYSLLCNANVWIRHMVAYQESLLFFLLALWLLCSTARSDKQDFRRLVIPGLLTGLGYSCYPGHYAFVIINAAVALVRPSRRIVSTAAFGLSSAAVIGVFELLARLTGRSYFGDLRSLSGAITMGDPKEGYLFVWHYLMDVEGVVGVALFALFCGFVGLVLWRRDARVPRTARVAIIAATGCYLFHASMGVLAGRMVFYGRVLMVYLPFVVVGAVLALMYVGRPRLRRLGVGGLLAASVCSFATFASEYRGLVYPAEFLQETMTRIGRDAAYPPNVLWGFTDGDRRETVEWLDPELVNVTDSRPDGSDVFVLLASHREARESNARFICVNLKFMWYIRERYDRFTPPEGHVLIAGATHPEVFAATGYEGRRPWERKRIQKRQYTMRIYERITNYESRITNGESG